MNPIIWIVLASLLGSIAYTLWGYLWKQLKEPNTPFSVSYLFSMLISSLLGAIIMPFLLNNQNILDTLLPVVLVGCFSFGFTINGIVNTPLTYYINKVGELEKRLKRLSSIKTSSRRIIEIVGVIALVCAIGGASVMAALNYSTTITASGTITGVGIKVFSDNTCTVEVNSVNWGNIAPGGSVTVSLWIKSTSTVPVTLSMQTGSWSPIGYASTLTFSWNYNNATILPGAVLKTDWTLTASTTATPGTSFSFNIVITATST
jgi:hypothetical protein